MKTSKDMQKESLLHEKYAFLKPLKQPVSLFAFISLILYGTLYHISSSEFWPITMSKTWLPGENFEYSMLQKPLFTLFLSFFHILPFSDTTHLLLLKVIFSLLGFFSIYLFVFSYAIFTKTSQNQHKILYLFLITTLIPTLLNNFFRIRSDQLTLFFFSIFFYFLALKKIKSSILFAILVLFTSIKSIVFLPIIIVFLIMINKEIFIRLVKKHIILISLSLMSILVWMVAFNINSFYYFLGTFNNHQFINTYLKKFLYTEFPLLFLSTYLALKSLFRKNETLFFKLTSTMSIYSTLLIILNPQSYPFYISSLILFSYSPLLVLFLSIGNLNASLIRKYTLTGLLLIFYSYSVKLIIYKDELYRSNFEQIEFISQTEKWLKKNNLNYLDGMGTMPRQKFLRCFVSPNDDESNRSCQEKIYTKSPDVIIITQRLAFFSQEIFSFLEKNYEQVGINIWIKNELKTQLKTQPTNSNIKPLFIFDFEG